MATKLDNSNIKSVCSKVQTKGFDISFWREYRSNVCKGKGVGKALDELKKLGVRVDGSAKDAALEDLDAVASAYQKLKVSLSKALSKCGNGQSHTKQFIQAYLDYMKAVPKHLSGVRKTKSDDLNLGYRKDLYKVKGYCKASFYYLDGTADDFKDIAKEIQAIPKLRTGVDGKKLALKHQVDDFTDKRKEYVKRRKSVDDAIKQARSLKEPNWADNDSKKALKQTIADVTNMVKRMGDIEKSIKDCMKQMAVTKKHVESHEMAH
jgi:hypothetical protein